MARQKVQDRPTAWARAPQVFVSPDGDPAELSRDGGQHLDVEQGEPLVAQVFQQVEQRDLRRVAGAVEHRFAGEESADSDAVDAAGELVLLPALEAVGMALLVEARVGVEEFRADPGRPPTARRGRAAFHHLSEGLVAGDLELPLTNHAREAAGEVKTIELEDGSRVGGPPGDGIRSPGEYAAPIGQQQAIYRQVAAHGDQPFVVREARVGEPEALAEDNEVHGKTNGLTRRSGAPPGAPFGNGRPFPSPKTAARSARRPAPTRYCLPARRAGPSCRHGCH